MFSAAERAALRDQLVSAAEADGQITAAALVGSAARDAEDQWSDIDLALRLAPGLAPADVVTRWTARMYDDHDAIAHFDVSAGGALYRVFLLASTLQVDLSLWPSDRFAPVGGPFRLLFGDANTAAPTAPRPPEPMIGLAWLYALHARSSIARNRCHQALHMLNGLRDQVVGLACLRSGLPPDQGRGVDDLDVGIQDALARTLVGDLRPAELARAFGRLVELLLEETAAADAEASAALEPVLAELVRTASAPVSPSSGDRASG